MPAPKGTLKERLSRYHQIKISVIGMKSGADNSHSHAASVNADCRSNLPGGKGL
jgi:hypothetical protein